MPSSARSILFQHKQFLESYPDSVKSNQIKSDTETSTEMHIIISAKEDYVVVVVCLSVCLYVRLLATLRKNVQTDLLEIFRVGRQWTSEQTIKFWWRSGSGIRIRIETLVRRALAEVCTVPVLLVSNILYQY